MRTICEQQSLECVGELRNSESRATFVSTKMQNGDQTVGPTDRPPMGRNFASFFDLKRKRRHNLRHVVNAILWLLRSGCQWRNLTKEWPHWQAVYYYGSGHPV